MNEIRVFESEMFGKIRTFEFDGELWFVGKDVAIALGYEKPENALIAHVDAEDKTTTLIRGNGSNYKSKTTIINESGLYSLIFGSKKESAKSFKHWVTSEILPELRKTGKYVLKTKYEETRDKSKRVRNAFTESLKNHGYSKPHEYINTTKNMKKELGITAKKDDMTMQELAAVSASEWLSIAMLTDEHGYHKVNPVCVKASDAVIGAIEENKRTAIA